MALAPRNFNNRKLLLGSLLLLTVLAAVWPVPDHEPISHGAGGDLTPKHHRNQVTTVNIAFTPLVHTTAPAKNAAVGDIFPPQTWAPPPSLTAQQAPVAPPLPFTFGGRYTDGGKVTLFLMEGNQMYRVQQGDTVKGAYRVEKIEQASVSLTYLPLGITQTLPTGDLLP